MIQRSCGTKACQHFPVVPRPHNGASAATNDLTRSAFCVMATSAANERVFSMDSYMVNSRRANLQDFISEPHSLYQQCFGKGALKFY